MKHTIFDTPLLRIFFLGISNLILFIAGWKADGKSPDVPKCVIIAAPHTSNWDLPLALFFAFHFGIKIHWLGKDSLFKTPFEGFFKWLGGIPINRSQKNQAVQQSIKHFDHFSELCLMVPPSGTRSSVTKWKTGFYYIADGAKVPIVMGYLDYKRKVGGLGPLFFTTGDYQKDIKEIKSFYSNIQGRFNHSQDIEEGDSSNPGES